ncbi:MAG: ribonuclease J [bacterium]|nr:ribonuclease J [bacterium]
MIKKETDSDIKEESIRIIPLGGLGEVGRNMMLIEAKNKILIIDAGLRMPEEDMPGVDYIIPSINYLKGKTHNIIGLIITHGHYDHIGALPYIMDRLGNPQIFTSKLTKGMILKRQEEFPTKIKLRINEVKSGEKIKAGPFTFEAFHQNHNIPDNLGFVINTPVGNIVNTSDFKFDETAVNDMPTDFKKLEKIGKNGVLLLMSDSTDAEEEGHSISEQVISENIEEIFKKAEGRIILATFASLLNRIQQIITYSEKYKRKVIIEGYGMKTNIAIAQKMGYLKIPKGILVSSKEIDKFPDNQITVICTGAQGESQASLMRIANKEHRNIHLKKKDTVVFSSSVIPGNERTVQIMKDDLYRQGAIVFHYKMMDIHAGGHAKQDELKKMIEIMKPRFFMPIHGQYSMLVKHKELATSMGIPEKNIIVAENGEVIRLTNHKITKEKEKVPANYVMVDGLGIGDVGQIVLRDRQALAQDGMFVIIVVVDRQTGKVRGSPDIISRGFVYLRESKTLLLETRKIVVNIVHQTTNSGKVFNWVYVKERIREGLSEYLFQKTQRRPMVLPVVIEV